MAERSVDPTKWSRRQFIGRGAAAAALLAPTSAAFLAACGSSTTGGSGGGKTSASNPFGVNATAPLDVVIFNGGYGFQWAKAGTAAYTKKYPKAQIKFADTTQIEQQYQGQFTAGTPPDVMDDSGASFINPATLVAEHQLSALDDLWSAPSIDNSSKKNSDLVTMPLQQPAIYSGKHYVLLYALTVYGIWYSSTLLKQKGWKYPETWADMLSLCEEIKGSTSMAPWTYQGIYPYYVADLWFQMVGKLGGNEILLNIDNLKPNAWMNDAVEESLNALYQLYQKGYIMPGTAGLTHIQSQAAWLAGKAAFIPDGSWVENEMTVHGVIPPTFDMVVAPTPSVSSNDKIPFSSASSYAGENVIVPSKGKNVAGGKELCRILLSKQVAGKFTELTKSLTIVNGAADNLSIANTDSALKSQIEWIKATKEQVTFPSFPGWYAQMNTDIGNLMGKMMTGGATPQQFQSQAQAIADKTKSDPTIPHYSR
ncbi:MAG: N-acetylglucosamine/diacetylchitobiose ABC transporter substrate-binding protein [Candidatus Dormibacteraceae bacterium]